MSRTLDSRISSEHIARYGPIDTERYLAVIKNIPELSDEKRGENHHLLAKSIWPQYANLKANPWNRLRVSHAVHIALTDLQGEFENRLRRAALLMKGQSTEAFLEMCRINGTLQGRKNVESGHLARIQKLGASLGGKITGNITKERRIGIFALGMAAVGGRIQGKKNVESGHISRLGTIQGPIQGNKNIESGHLARLRTPEHQRNAGIKRGMTAVASGQLAEAAMKGRCSQNIRRGKPCVCGKH
jgi:hypothetical protein